MNLKRKLNIIICFLLAIAPVGQLHGQIARFDSLKNIIDNLPDKQKINALHDAAVLFEQSSMDKSLYFAAQRGKILEGSKNDSLIASNYNLIGNIYLESGLLDRAKENYLKALEIYRSIQSWHGISTETHNMGFLYHLKDDTIRSLDYFKLSLDARYKTMDKRRIGDGLTTLGEVYFDFGNYESSISSLTRAIEYYDDLGSYGRKFDCYCFLADNFLLLNPDMAWVWIREMENIYAIDTSNKLIKKHRIDYRIGQYYLNKGYPEEAAEYFIKINIDSTLLQDEFNPVETYMKLSDIFRKKGDIYNSLHFSSLARELNNRKNNEQIKDIINSYRTRLDVISVEDEINRTEELNKVVLQRIKTEGLFKLAMFIVIIVLSVILIIILRNFISIKRSQYSLNLRKEELEFAYKKSIANKDKILDTRRNKRIFFDILTDKLLVPFTDLTDRLNKLSKDARASFNKKTFLIELGNIYTIALSIEKSLKRILIWSKIQRKKYEVNPENIIVSDYMHDLLPSMLKMAVRKNIKIRFDINPEMSIHFDSKSLKSIIKVFIENSIDHSPKGSEIIIRGQVTDKGSLISITDFGEGISPEIQQKLFNINTTREKTDNGAHDKLGIGLLLARHLSEMNKSNISYSTTPGRGTTLTLHITDNHAR